ncbi:MAG: CPXCG motif-containing cysteine-rich protein [Ignavibacteriae bacterium]|nr:CPXCG motif-containing cysteine-rich protein [Ignavibacteriota bacterium]
MEIEATFVCAYCLQVNSIVIDSSGGRGQQYIEDCQVCCRPNKLTVTIDEKLTDAEVHAEIA